MTFLREALSLLLLLQLSSSFTAGRTKLPLHQSRRAASAASTMIFEGKNGSARVVCGGGCFWCTEAVFNQLDGVLKVTSGYAGGKELNPTYQDICEGVTGHAEVVQVEYDSTRLKYDDLLDIFFKSHNPTQGNRQGFDVGSQYRSIILYEDPDQLDRAKKAIARAEKTYAAGGLLGMLGLSGGGDGSEKGKVTTELKPLSEFPFWSAERYHQNYYDRNRASPYCMVNIDPKLIKLRPLVAALNKGPQPKQ